MTPIPIDEYIALRRLLNSARIGIVSVRAMLDLFGSGLKTAETPAKVVGESLRLNEAAYKGFIEGVNNSDFDEEFRKDYDYILSIGGAVISYGSESYPAQLANIYDPPVLLNIIGEISEKDEKSLGIVGTRTPTPYGTRIATDIATGLDNENFTIISGLARGIDTTAHKATLAAGGRTIAVLGSGFKNLYPPENRKLAKEITENNGAIITEYPPAAKPDAINFPARNRIISGLGLGVLVVEAAEKGGALHTAAFANDQGRAVFAIPGNINSKKSGGTNRLIQNGEAKLVMETDDILEELNIKPIDRANAEPEELPTPPDLSIFEEKIFSALGFQPIHIDEISAATGLSVSECLSNLLSLELKGIIRQTPGKNFVKR
ncbi:MAG: DNA protecting protein DprA [Ignavibacteriales bacterium UTCHB3]|nr:MAG: DNA protecting protein DprA [Ignavibacteriales bacterium UTCHB3]